MFDWPRPVVHFEIRAKNKEKLAAFYRELFEWNMEEQAAVPITLIGPGKGPPEQGIAGHIIENAAAPGVAIYVQVADLAASLRKAGELGGKATAQPFDVPGGHTTIAQIADPEGNLIGLIQM